MLTWALQELPIKQTAALHVPLAPSAPSSASISSSNGGNAEAAYCFMIYKGFDEHWKAAVSTLEMRKLRLREIK